jgi:hypothetical protein
MVVGVQRHPSCDLPLSKRPGSLFTRGCVGPRADLEGFEKFQPTAFRSPDSPARRQVHLYAGA